MSSGWIPKGVLRHIEGHFRKFLWSRDGRSRGISLVAWEELCKPIADGGLGLRELEPMHQALMGKLLARIIAKPDSALHRVLRSKYGQISDVWDWRVNKASSSAWRAISKGRDVIRDGMKWELGNGTDIRVLRDPWLSTTPLCWSPTMVAFHPRDNAMVVADFITSTKDWNIAELRRVFPNQFATSIASIPVPQGDVRDQVRWLGKPLDKVTVKELYESLNRTDDDGERRDWKWLWRLPCAYRIRAWMWKAVKGCVQTKAFLFRRGLVGDMICPRCGEYAEDLQHLLMDCSHSTAIWGALASAIGKNLSFLQTKEVWNFLQSSQLRGGMNGCSRVSYVVYAMWSLWKQRNDRLFKGLQCNSDQLGHRIKGQVTEWLGQKHTKNKYGGTADRCLWVPPRTDELKLNFDGSFIHGHDLAGAGYVVRDFLGQLVLAGGTPLSASSPFESEERGVWEGVMALSCRRPGGKLWIEGDSMAVIEQLAEGGSTLILDAVRMFSCFEEVRVSHIGRECNIPADYMAKLSRTRNQKLVFESNFPEDLRGLTVRDVNSLNL